MPARITTMHRGRYAVLWAALMMLGCEQERLEVRAAPVQEPYGRTELLRAVDSFVRSDRSPTQFRDLVQAIEEARPRFDAAVTVEAERDVVFLALGILEDFYQKPPAVQMESLATTVWPVALDVVPAPDEAPAGYIRRLCQSEMAAKCKDTVPEYQPLIVSSLVWSQLRDRARESLQECRSCQGEPGFADDLVRYERHAEDIWIEARAAQQKARPGLWPRAGNHAAPWSGAPLLMMNENGETELDGRAVAPGTRRQALEAAQKQGAVLGVHLSPRALIADLRSIVDDAAAAGFQEIALQARLPGYPYTLLEYRLTTGKGPRPALLRDTDTIQVLSVALDNMSAAGNQLPGL